jgi:CHAD domain-containing protein
MDKRLMTATSLGQELIIMGKISKAQLNYALSIQGEKKLGEVLTDLGYISQKDVDLAEQRQVQNRQTMPENTKETADALQALRSASRAYHRSTQPGMKAFDVSQLKKAV